jgi:hypothetical protein
LQKGDKTANPYYGSKMFSCGEKVGTLSASAAPTPATRPGTAPAVSSVAISDTYRQALQPYLTAQKRLSEDKAEGVPELLQESVTKLTTAKDAPAVRDNYPRLAEAVNGMKGQGIEQLRVAFKDVSAAMIEIGKGVGTPAGAGTVKIFRCPMKKANWLQEGDATANPYYGAMMYDCGSAVESLPRISPEVMPTRQRGAPPTGKLLAVPRSAVIDTGRLKIVYVESTPGVYDMHAVKLGPLATSHASPGQPPEEWYPVVEGLEEGDRIVTVGTFLIDAENRLNPTRNDAPTVQPSMTEMQKP